MKRQKKQLAILLVILLVCVAGYFGATMYSSRVAQQEELADAEYEVLSFEDADLAQLQIEGSAGELLLSYNGSIWSFVNDIDAEMTALSEAQEEETGETDTEEANEGTDDSEETEVGESSEEDDADRQEEDSDEDDADASGEEDDAADEVGYEVNTTTASTILGYLDSLTSEYQITPNEDLSEYGLDDPSMTITITLTDGTIHTLVFGDYNDYISAYYYYLDEPDVLYAISNYTYNILNKCDTDLADEAETEEAEE